MNTSESGLTDGVTVQVSGEPGLDRPADGAPKGAWVDYVVALGADRTFVTTDTRHFDGAEYATEPGLTRPQLIDLADRLGG